MTSERLQKDLERSLRHQLSDYKSPEYALIWKLWDMKSEPQICALRASALPTSDRGSGGWPTPNASEGSKGQKTFARGNPSLSTAAKMAGWQTPSATDGERGGTITPNMTGQSLQQMSRSVGWPTPKAITGGPNSKRKERGSGGPDLQEAAGWVTPSSRDWKDTPGMSLTGTNPDGSQRKRLDQLPRQAAIAGWGTPTQTDGRRGSPDPEYKNKTLNHHASGANPNTSPVPTEKRGALNPELARWLMGFPDGWGSYADTVTRSSRRSRRNS